MWFRGKHERVPEGDGKPFASCSAWQPGELVAFEDIFVPVRTDMFILDEGEYVAIDHHCPDPTCECRQMIVEFSQDDDIAAMRVQPDGRCALESGDPELLRALWAAYVLRHPNFLERLRARTEVMRTFGREFREWSTSGVDGRLDDVLRVIGDRLAGLVTNPPSRQWERGVEPYRGFRGQSFCAHSRSRALSFSSALASTTFHSSSGSASAHARILRFTLASTLRPISSHSCRSRRTLRL